MWKVIRFIFISAITASLMISSGLRAQYQWHVVHSDRADTLYYSFTSISCSGESCSAIGVVWGYNPNEPPILQLTDSNFILTSTNGGLNWTTIPSGLPAWHYSANGKGGLKYQAIDQIDSLNAVMAGGHATVLRTSDHWQTWHADTGLHPPLSGMDTLNLSFAYMNFPNPAEGAVEDNVEGYSYATVDSGKHWFGRKNLGGWHSYGGGLFRSFISPDTLLATTDEWASIDTLVMTLDGPFTNNGIEPISLQFGNGDTLEYICARVDADGNQNVAIAFSTNLGVHWTELPLPKWNGIDPGYAAFSPVDAPTIAIGGKDTVGRILLSTDHGATWQEDTVPFSDGVSYSRVAAIAVTGSGRVIASITTDNDFEGSQVLAYLEQTTSGVTPAVSMQQNLTLYPNPATNALTLDNASGNISILDPLGRNYSVPRNGNTLDVSSLPTGVYFVSDGVSRAKFVKE